MMKSQRIRKLTYAALFLALAMVLPLITGQIPEIGKFLCPMHIPALLCGFLCGWPWGLAVGFIAPLMRSVIFGMPAMFPDAVVMAFELAAYGFAAGLLRRLLPKKVPFLYISLIVSMVLGRVVYCVVAARILGGEAAFLAMFTQQFVKTWIGILIHLAVVPPIVLAIEAYRKRNP